jgi:hypothetical protein
MAFCGRIEVRLLEDEGHAEHAFPEIYRGLPVGADERYVVNALSLQLAHMPLLSGRTASVPAVRWATIPSARRVGPASRFLPGDPGVSIAWMPEPGRSVHGAESAGRAPWGRDGG